jgi:tetratricopeptide (TPR) repeat protein
MKKASAILHSGVSLLKLLCAAAVIFTSISAFAQRRGNSPPPSPPPSAPAPPTSATKLDQNRLILDSNEKQNSQKVAKEDNCFLPPLNMLQATRVGIADLQVPANSQREYESGCAALRNRKTADAENHLRKAVKQYPKYSAAWVLLGQILAAQQKTSEAREACSQPVATDSSYVPAHLCLADISARLQSWDETLKHSARAIEIDPTTDAVAYAYNAAANLNLHNLPEAEKSALKASEIDRTNADPRVHFLLAQIYEAKGDREREAAQLREYLPYATDPDDAAMVKSYLAALGK